MGGIDSRHIILDALEKIIRRHSIVYSMRVSSRKDIRIGVIHDGTLLNTDKRLKVGLMER